MKKEFKKIKRNKGKAKTQKPKLTETKKGEK